MELPGQAKCYYFSYPLSYNWDSVLCSRVSNHVRVSLSPSGRDILNKVQASWIWNQLFLMEQTVNPRVWTDGKTVGRAQNAVPAFISLSDPHLFSHQKQYPLKPEVNEKVKS